MHSQHRLQHETDCREVSIHVLMLTEVKTELSQPSQAAKRMFFGCGILKARNEVDLDRLWPLVGHGTRWTG